MDYFAGLDASLETVNVCTVNGDGSVVLEQKVGAEPQAIVALLKQFGRPLKRVGLEAGPTSSWLSLVASGRLSSTLSRVSAREAWSQRHAQQDGSQ
jgi:hypothetical protein